jgi:hypothetical protein
VFSKTWPADREQRARIIDEWLQSQGRFLCVIAEHQLLPYRLDR